MQKKNAKFISIQPPTRVCSHGWVVTREALLFMNTFSSCMPNEQVSVYIQFLHLTVNRISVPA